MDTHIFRDVNDHAGHAIPTQDFWDMWHSEKKDSIRRLGFQPTPGKEIGATEKWIVLLPREDRFHRYNETKHISEILNNILVFIEGNRQAV